MALTLVKGAVPNMEISMPTRHTDNIVTLRCFLEQVFLKVLPTASALFSKFSRAEMLVIPGSVVFTLDTTVETIPTQYNIRVEATYQKYNKSEDLIYASRFKVTELFIRFPLRELVRRVTHVRDVAFRKHREFVVKIYSPERDAKEIEIAVKIAVDLEATSILIYEDVVAVLKQLGNIYDILDKVKQLVMELILVKGRSYLDTVLELCSLLKSEK